MSVSSKKHNFQPIDDVNRDHNNFATIECLLGIDIDSFSPASKNRAITYCTNLDGFMAPGFKEINDLWSKKYASHDNSREMTQKGAVPRSNIVDSFFKHQLPGIEDSSLTDIRELVSLQSKLEKMSIAATRKAQLVHYRYTRANKHNTTNEEYDQFSAIKRILRSTKMPKAPHCSRKIKESSIARVLEATEKIPVDYTNGLFGQTYVVRPVPQDAKEIPA